MAKTAKELREEAAKLLEQAEKIEREGKDKEITRSKPKVEDAIPDADPEAQALERERYNIGLSLNNAPDDEGDKGGPKQ